MYLHSTGISLHDLAPTYIIISKRAAPTRDSAEGARSLKFGTLVVVADRTGHEVTAADSTSEVEFFVHFHDCNVIVHPPDVVVLMAIEHVI